MASITHLRVIFPLGFSYRNMIKTFWSEKEGCLMGEVLHKNDYWLEDVMTPNFAPDMEVHVGVEREPEADIFGKLVPCPAQGILRGEFCAWTPLELNPRAGSGGWGWLAFRLRYDMQEGPEIWEADWAKVYTTGQAPAFYYALEGKE